MVRKVPVLVCPQRLLLVYLPVIENGRTNLGVLFVGVIVL